MSGETALPHSKELEQQVLGAMMSWPRAVDRVMGLLERDSFYIGRHQQIFDLLLRMHDEQKSTDLTTIAAELEKRGLLKQCGGPAYLADVAASVGTSVHVTTHAELVRELAMRRRIILYMQLGMHDAYDRSVDVHDTLDSLEQGLSELTNAQASDGFRPASYYATEVYDRIEAAQAQGGRMPGVSTGYYQLDRCLGGLQGGSMYVIGARPRMGKTALLLNFARYIAIRGAVPMAICSMEMTGAKLTERILAAMARIDTQALERGQLNQEQWTAVSEVTAAYSQAPLYIDQMGTVSAMELRAKARRLVRDKDVRVLAIDYIQLMRPDQRAQNREQEVAGLSRALKGLAMELKIPVIVVAQLNRQVETRADMRPRLADLRESGALEQDADVVIFVHRPEELGRKTDPETGESTEGRARLIVAKHRNGPTIDVDLRWIGAWQRFDAETTAEDESPI